MTEIPGESFGEEPITPRQPTEGMGVAVARRTVFRDSDNQNWGKVADRVAEGNMSCLWLLKEPPSPSAFGAEQKRLRNAIATGALLTSGRHLQHGDADQWKFSQEKWTNCSTSATSFGLAYLLLAGSGVGRSYDDDMLVVDWAAAPNLWLILNKSHKDFPGTVEEKRQFYQDCSNDYSDKSDEFYEQFFSTYVHCDLPEGDPPEGGAPYYEVEDSREGWAKAVEIFEAMAYNKEKDGLLILNFSKIRPAGSPIGGMQNRPCSGPISWMRAFVKAVLRVIEPARRGEMELWEQAMVIDHSFAEEVLVAGARRAARLAAKSWRDSNVFGFIEIKNKKMLWTANNSVMVDKEFWSLVNGTSISKLALHAKAVFGAVTKNSYIAGEPGLINGDLLEDTKTGFGRKKPVYFKGEDFESQKYKTIEGRKLLADLSMRAANTRFLTIVNPCGEIALHTMGGFCVIADLAPLLACPVSFDRAKSGHISQKSIDLWDARVLDSAKLAARFLIRVNLMDSVYRREVLRTNRIGVSFTGIHEYAWLRWGYSFRDLLDEQKSKDFWQFMKFLSESIKEEANNYSDELGVSRCSTVMTVKPSGSVSKLFGVSEGAHLPARRQYLRWVQFRGEKDDQGNWKPVSDPLLQHYEEKGYPIRQLKTFQGMSIVGFPTMPLIQSLGIKDKLVIAPEASPAEQYKWLQLIEKYWLGESQANQVSYTLKVYTDKYSLDEYRKIVLENQPKIKCCSLLPSKPDREMGYEYLPEEEISAAEFRRIKLQSGEPIDEEIDMQTLYCEGGACPI